VSRPPPPYPWVVVVRAVANGVEPLSVLYSADDEGLPNQAELDRLRVGVEGLFKERWGMKPERSAVAVLPWVTSDGDWDRPSWRVVLRRLRA
jgi:hypothetical protein